MNKKILTLMVAGFLVSANHTTLFADDDKEAAKSETKTTATDKGDAKEKTEDKPKLKISITGGDSPTELSLPSINEIHKDAKNAKVTGDWNKLVKLEIKDYTSMKVAERAFEVGKTLSDISFLVLELDTPPKALQEAALNALSAIKLPDDLKAELQTLKEEKGSLKGEALRKKMDSLITMLLALQESKDVEIRDSGMTLLAAGYFKSFYLAAKTVKDYKKPTEDQLVLFSWSGLTNDFIDYFKNTASADFKNDENIKIFLAALEKIKPIVDKPREDITKADVATIAAALSSSFE